MDQHSHGHAHVAGVEFLLVLLFLTVVLGLYGLGARKEHQRNSGWKPWRTTSFMLGLVLLAAALSPPVANWAHWNLSGHMVQHLLLGMYAPLALVLGAPGTLLLRNIPVSTARCAIKLLGTKPVRLLIHPFTALALNMGGMCLLYLTPLYALSTQQQTSHILVHIHFILAGYLFTWSIAGPDPAPHRPTLPLRLAVLFSGTAIHAALGKWMYAYGYPRGTGHKLEEIQAAAQLMYYGGDVAELLLAAAFFSIWFGKRGMHTNKDKPLIQQQYTSSSV